MKCPVCGFDTTLSQCAQCGHCLINVFEEGEPVAITQLPPQYKFDKNLLLESKLDSLEVPGITARLSRKALQAIEVLMMIRIFGIEYYTLRYDAFDTLTRLGYKLNLVTGQYYK